MDRLYIKIELRSGEAVRPSELHRHLMSLSGNMAPMRGCPGEVPRGDEKCASIPGNCETDVPFFVFNFA